MLGCGLRPGGPCWITFKSHGAFLLITSWQAQFKPVCLLSHAPVGMLPTLTNRHSLHPNNNNNSAVRSGGHLQQTCIPGCVAPSPSASPCLAWFQESELETAALHHWIKARLMTTVRLQLRHQGS